MTEVRLIESMGISMTAAEGMQRVLAAKGATLPGRSHEWETVPDVEDAVPEGRHKALILLMHEVSEEAGMKECARWVQTVLPGIPVAFIPAREPFPSVRASAAGRP